MNYFKVTSLGDGIYRIWEKKGVGEYLIKGSAGALLIDTGYGHPELYETVKSLTGSLPLTVVNSHFHPDHSAGNKYYDEVYIGQEDIPGDGGSDLDKLLESLKENNRAVSFVVSKLFGSVDSGKCKYIPLSDGFEFDLGDRKITAIKMSGHTKGSFMFSDSKTSSLFTGDACNNATWLFTNPDQSAGEYSDRVLKAFDSLSGIKTVYFSHSSEAFGIDYFRLYSDFLRNIYKYPSKKIKLKSFESPLCIVSTRFEKYGSARVFIFENQV